MPAKHDHNVPCSVNRVLPDVVDHGLVNFGALVMMTYEPGYLAAATLLAGAIGLEGRLYGRRWALFAGFAAMSAGYGLVVANGVFAPRGLGIPEGAFGPAAAICFAGVALLEWLLPRRGDRANHFVALVFGVGAAAQESAILVAGFMQMLALFVARAEQGGEEVIGSVEFTQCQAEMDGALEDALAPARIHASDAVLRA